MDSLSLTEARRLALAAQGLVEPPRGVVAAVRRMGALQMDSVNVVARAHYLTLFSRLGPYRRELLDRAAYGPRRALFEYWGHECSLMPVEMWPLFEFRRQQAARGEAIYRSVARARKNAAFVNRIEREVRERGPLTAGELSDKPRSLGGWWGWSEHKRALEYLFWSGRLCASSRRNFERVYDVVERVIPAEVRARPVPDVPSQQRALVLRAAVAMGVATLRDLQLYFRLSSVDTRACISELVEEGALREVRVESWKQPAWLARGARLPREVDAAALLAPFDPLAWDRARMERLFGFHYRIALYTPRHLRPHGYYVLPFLLGERMVARVDLKSDRAAGALLVRGLHLEKGVSRGEVLPRLHERLAAMAAWLGLQRVEKK